MQLGGTPPQLFNQARGGIADFDWTLAGCTAGRFTVTEIFELPFITTTHVPCSKSMWDFVQDNAMDEYRGVKLIGTWVNGANQLHMRNKPVESLEDLKGLKVRAPSRLGNRILDNLGRSEEHTSELQSRGHLVCRLLLEKKKDVRVECRRCCKKV